MQAEFPPLVQLYINGSWRSGHEGRTLDIENPATGAIIGSVACAAKRDIEEAAEISTEGFRTWSRMPARQRALTLRKAARILEDRAESIARILVLEQGKPLREARAEIALASDLIDWFSEEAQRLYGRLVPGRHPSVTQQVVPHPVGPSAAFTPWNFPINQAVRKISAALAAGCSIVIKGPEETPASCAELVRAFHDAGIPPGVINLLYGEPSEISSILIAHSAIRKVSFTGSTAVGKRLAAMAGQHMKRMTMELGGHAVAVITEDTDIALAADLLGAAKFRNAGQVCVSPTRFLVHRSVANRFTEAFVEKARSLRVGPGSDEANDMGPLVNHRRRQAISSIVEDAVLRGARIVTGGSVIPGPGYFFAPTVLVDVPLSATIMNEEPFGPVAPIVTFDSLDEALTESNRLKYGLAAYVFSNNGEYLSRFKTEIEAGMLTINHLGLSHPELPFGGIKDSGIGSEGGPEALEAYTYPRLITQLDL